MTHPLAATIGLLSSRLSPDHRVVGQYTYAIERTLQHSLDLSIYYAPGEEFHVVQQWLFVFGDIPTQAAYFHNQALEWLAVGASLAGVGAEVRRAA